MRCGKFSEVGETVDSSSRRSLRLQGGAPAPSLVVEAQDPIPKMRSALKTASAYRHICATSRTEPGHPYCRLCAISKPTVCPKIGYGSMARVEARPRPGAHVGDAGRGLVELVSFRGCWPRWLPASWPNGPEARVASAGTGVRIIGKQVVQGVGVCVGSGLVTAWEQ